MSLKEKSGGPGFFLRIMQSKVWLWNSPGDFRKEIDKRKGPRTKAPFTSHHPLPPKRSFNDYLIDAGF
jgi:hypothetical protein